MIRTDGSEEPDLPEKYVRREGLPLLVRHTGPTTLPEDPPRSGAGPAIVCLHDAGLQSSVFSELLVELEERLDGEGGAIAFDLPGHGRSGSLDSLPSIEAMAEMASWVSAWCRLKRPILVGHGMGALVALEWARARSEPVAGLVLCGTGLGLGTSEASIEQMRRVSQGKAPRPFDPARVAKGASPDLLRRAYMEGIQTDPRATLVDLEASSRWSETFAAEEPEIACPVRVVVGEDEPAECRARAESLAQRLAAAETSAIADAAHLLPLEQPGALAATVLELREVA
jgi:pimeloyl-ACP methyl ester carboxylesterase